MPNTNKLSQTFRNLRFSSIDAIAATPWTLLSLPGSFLAAGFLNVLFGVGPFWFGIISAMPAIANALHIVLVPVTARFLKVRDLTLSMGWLNAGLWLSGVVGMAFLPIDEPDTAGWFFAILYFLASVSMSMVALGWMTWVTDFVPSRIRGRYLGRRNRFANVATITFILLSILLLGITDASREAYVVLCALAVLLRCASMMVQHLIESPSLGGGELGSANWAKDIFRLRSNKPLMQFVLFGSLIGFWLGCLGTVVPMYALGELSLTPARFTSLALTATLSGAIFLRIWGELIDRHGAVPVVIICMAAWRLVDYGWMILTPSTTYLLYPIWAWGGVMGTGYLLASFSLLLKLVPKQSRSTGISLNLTATSIAAGIAPVLMGFFLHRVSGLGWDMVPAYQTIFFLINTGGLLTIFIIWKLPEPETMADRNNIPGAMRTLRYLTVNQGLGFLSNATFVVRRRTNGS